MLFYSLILVFNPFMPGGLKRDIGKQRRHRSDAIERGFRSGSTLFTFSKEISINHGYIYKKKNNQIPPI